LVTRSARHDGIYWAIVMRCGRLVPQARSPRSPRSAGSGPRVHDEFCTPRWPAQAISPRSPPPPSSATPP